MSTGFFSVLPVMAKGRGGGGSSGGISAINDNWDAPAIVKTKMAFLIIFGIISLIQFSYILKNLRLVPTMSAKAPFLLLAFVTLTTTVAYILWGVFTRLADDLLAETAQSIDLALKALFAIIYAFRPAVVLWLLQQRGALLQATKGNTIQPLATRAWKRGLDWTLPTLVVIFYIVIIGVDGNYYATINNSLITRTQSQQYLQVRRSLGHTLVAFMLILLIDVIVSVIVMYNQGKTAQSTDLVTRRLLFVVVPFTAIFALELLSTDIYASVTVDKRPLKDTYSLVLAEVIIEGICTVIITAGLIATMTLPGVQWTAQQAQAAPNYPATPGQQWSTPNSGWTQPLYNPPQQSPYVQQQQPFYPQQQPYYQQPQQPNSIPTHAGPH